MNYNKFKRYVKLGHEFEGFIDNRFFRVLNIYDEKITIIIDNQHYNLSYEEMFNNNVYKEMTFKELFDKNYIDIKEMF